MLERKNELARRLYGTALLMAALTFVPTAGVARADGPIVQVKIKDSLPNVLDHLKKIVADNGMMVMGELHQGNVLSMTGLEVQSETVFVGNPTVGKKLFSADPGVGLVVPIRINLYVDAEGQTVVSYLPPSYLLKEYDNPKVDGVAKMLDGKVQGMVKMLSR